MNTRDHAQFDMSNSVDLVFDNDHWVVRVIESGVLTECTFTIETYAVSFTDGQRLRLELELNRTKET